MFSSAANADTLKDSIILKQNEILELIKSQSGNTLFSVKDIFLLIIGGLLGGIISYSVTLFIDKKRERKRVDEFGALYKKYAGIYLAYDKYDKNIIHHMVRIRVEHNTFLLDYGLKNINSKPFSGKILLNDQNPYYGIGYYHHEPSENGAVGFGFYEIQLVDDLILVHMEYFKNGKFLPYPRIWVKQPENDIDVFLRRFNEIMKLQIQKNDQSGI
jgi:hypothetical protein